MVATCLTIANDYQRLQAKFSTGGRRNYKEWLRDKVSKKSGDIFRVVGVFVDFVGGPGRRHTY